MTKYMDTFPIRLDTKKDARMKNGHKKHEGRKEKASPRENKNKKQNIKKNTKKNKTLKISKYNIKV